MSDFKLPNWLEAYRSGARQGYAQVVLAYADYYCLDGSADGDPSIEERLGHQAPAMEAYLNPSVGIFLGGSTEWKLQTMEAWGILARRRNCYFHVGRVNSARRIAMCAAASASSFDGTSVARFANTLPRLDGALKHRIDQADLYSLSRASMEDTPYDCRWPL